MDTKQGNIYNSFDDMVKAIGEKPAHARGVTGGKPTLRKLQKMIRAQLRREREDRDVPDMR